MRVCRYVVDWEYPHKWLDTNLYVRDVQRFYLRDNCSWVVPCSKQDWMCPIHQPCGLGVFPKMWSIPLWMAACSPFTLGCRSVSVCLTVPIMHFLFKGSSGQTKARYMFSGNLLWDKPTSILPDFCGKTCREMANSGLSSIVPELLRGALWNAVAGSCSKPANKLNKPV